MKQDRKQADIQRRDFLRGSVAAGAGATIAAAVPGAALASTREEAPAQLRGELPYNPAYRRLL